MVTCEVRTLVLSVRFRLLHPVKECFMNDALRLSFVLGMFAGILLLDVIYLFTYVVFW